MPETANEMLARVRLMADGDATWDLSDNDIAAIKYVLDLAVEAQNDKARLQTMHELRRAYDLIKEQRDAAIALAKTLQDGRFNGE